MASNRNHYGKCQKGVRGIDKGKHCSRQSSDDVNTLLSNHCSENFALQLRN